MLFTNICTAVLLQKYCCKQKRVWLLTCVFMNCFSRNIPTPIFTCSEQNISTKDILHTQKITYNNISCFLNSFKGFFIWLHKAILYSIWSIHWHNAYLNCCFSLIHLLCFFLCFHFFNVLMCFSALLIISDMNCFSLWSWSITCIIPKNRYQFTVHIL